MTELTAHPGFASHVDGNEPSLPPSPIQLDELITAYEHQQRIADETQTIADTLATQLIDVVRKHGSIPDTANQSWRMQGVHSTATVTVGVTKTLREEEIEKLHAYMLERGLEAHFFQMFGTTLKYTLVNGARDVMNGVLIPQRTRDKVLALFGMCIDVKDRKPALKVTAIKPEKPARQPRARKQAA